MAYSDFTLSKLKKQFGLEQEVTNLFTNIRNLQPSRRLKSDIEEGLSLPKNTEKARSENIISPILRELFRHNRQKMTFFPGYGLNVDFQRGLNGNCDYIVAGRANIAELTNPIICLVEGKNGVLEDGYGQCGAEMYAARIYNEDLGTPNDEIFGAVTNGQEWQFLMLREQTIYIDSHTFSLDRLSHILGILQYIVDKN